MILPKNIRYLYWFIIRFGSSAVFGLKCDGSLGLAWNSPENIKLSPDRFSASSSDDYNLPMHGRLNYPRSFKIFGIWCANANDHNPWFQVDLGSVQAVSKISVGSNDQVAYFITSYAVKYSYNGTLWFDVFENDTQTIKLFDGPVDYYDEKTVTLDRPLVARFVRLYPKQKSGVQYCMYVDFYGCFPKKVCNQKVGLGNASIISNERFAASSAYNNINPSEARLNNYFRYPTNWGAWCADNNDRFPWLQVDLGHVRELSEIETQGHPLMKMNAWVKSYKLNYSMNGQQWFEYGANKTFTANSDANESKTNILDPYIIARFIRILAISWKELPCLRVELGECTQPTELIPKLMNGLTDATINRGEQFDLKCEFTGQPGIILAWHKNGKFLPTDNRISTSYVENFRSLHGKLSFEKIKSQENGLIFTCLAWYPSLENFYSKSDALITVLSPSPFLNVTEVGTLFIRVSLSYYGNLTKDTIGYVLNVSSTNRLERLEIATKVDFNITGAIKPYKKYTIAVAIEYYKKEIGEYFSVVVETLQDKPSGAPLNLQVVKVLHDTLSCSWSLPDENLRNGIITHYIVRYKKSNKINEESVYMQKIVNKTEVVLYNLEAGANYEVSVNAYNMIGGGPFTHPPFLIFTGEATEELTELTKVVITTNNAAGIGKRLQNITADPNFLNKHDVTLTLDILEKVVEVENGSRLIGEALVTAVSNVLKANKTVLEESEIANKTGTRYVKVLEKWLETVDVKDKQLQETSENVVVRKVFIKKLELEEGIKFAEASIVEITIPAQALPKNDSKESVYFVYYKKNKFFSEPSLLEEQCVQGFTVVKERIYTPVVSGEVVGFDSKNLTAPVILKFKANGSMDLKASACVYWDFKANKNKGGWSKEGCQVHSIANQTITCHCNHLTNFAAMMDFYAHTSRACGLHKVLLSWISIIGCFLSMIGLFLTFLTYLLFRQLLKELAAKVLVQLCGAMLVVIFTFMTGFEQIYRPSVCVTVAVILHYFTLVVFMWMFMEALFMYYAFVKVWPPREGGDIYKTAAIAWGVPLVIVIITFATSWDSYGGKHFCHLTGTPLYVSYLAPIGLIIIVNLLIFLLIMYHLSTRPNSNTEASTVDISLTRLKRAFGIMILMGLTWGFGFGTASNARLEFSYLFATCNALQGFAIFLFYTVAQRNARMAWYRFLTCDPRSDRKRNADSYYERRRMSSGASNKTNSMHFERTSTCTSSTLQRNSSSIKGLVRNSSCPQLGSLNQYIMNTIQEDDSPLGSVITNNNFPDGLITAAIESVEIKNAAIKTLGSKAEDDLLNLRISREEEIKKKSDVKNYSSYRVLSSSSSYDLLDLGRSQSIHCLSETNINKELPTTEELNVFVEDSSPRKKTSAEILELSISDSIILSENYLNNVTNDKKRAFIDNTHNVPSLNLSGDVNGTIKSDVSTMTECFENDLGLMKPQFFGAWNPSEEGPGQNNVMRWLHNNCEEVKYDRDSDSDYSSSYYRTSRSSSVMDLVSDAQTNTMCSDGSCGRKLSKEQIMRENLVIGALKGLNKNNFKGNKTKLSLSSYSKPSSDEFSRESNGTISSEEGTSLDFKENKLKKRKIQKRSSTLAKKHYMSLEEPTPYL